MLRWDVARRVADWQNPVRRPLKLKVRIPDDIKPFFQADFEENEVKYDDSNCVLTGMANLTINYHDTRSLSHRSNS